MYFRRLRDLREDSDLNQAQVGELLGISQTVYSRYERGFQSIPLEHLIKLADYYNVSVDYMLNRTDNPEIKKWQKNGLKNALGRYSCVIALVLFSR